MTSGLTISVWNNAKDIERILPEWETLLEQVPSATISQPGSGWVRGGDHSATGRFLYSVFIMRANWRLGATLRDSKINGRLC